MLIELWLRNNMKKHKYKYVGNSNVGLIRSNTKPIKFYQPDTRKRDYSLNGRKLSNESMQLAKAGIGLAFAGLTLGIATKAFRNAFE